VAEITAEEIRDLRRSLGMSQEAFAQHLGVSVSSVRDWEQKRRRPRGLYARALEQRLTEAQDPKRAA
jgi:DNA-binding transcriptional regulator YiaG